MTAPKANLDLNISMWLPDFLRSALLPKLLRRTERSSPAPRVLVLSAHCAVEKSQPSLLLEDAVGQDLSMKQETASGLQGLAVNSPGISQL